MNVNLSNLYAKPMVGGAGVRIAVDDDPAVSIAASLTGTAKPALTKYFYWQVQAVTLYITFDGSTPSATNGYAYTAGTVGLWTEAAAMSAKAITASGTGYLMISPWTD